MGVTEVYEFLKANRGRKYLPADIAIELGLSRQSVTVSLRTLDTYEDIKSIYLQKDLPVKKRGGFYYAYKKSNGA